MIPSFDLLIKISNYKKQISFFITQGLFLSCKRTILRPGEEKGPRVLNQIYMARSFVFLIVN